MIPRDVDRDRVCDPGYTAMVGREVVCSDQPEDLGAMQRSDAICPRGYWSGGCSTRSDRRSEAQMEVG